MFHHSGSDETIFALSTPNGIGALGVIRLCGSRAFEICDRIFVPAGGASEIDKFPMVRFGHLVWKNEVIDELVVTYFKGPKSYTGENIVEFSCHGSPYIIMRIMEALIENGARQAKEGEFTLRAYLNGKMDLSKAEAVADLIHSENKASHQIAMHQLKGGFSNDLKILREKLIDFASLIELELDFGEEDVEFANRNHLLQLVEDAQIRIKELIDSFKYGNAIKKGITVTIAGAPNAGKSTLLNALLNEEKAIVSEIAGTTRDSIEDTMTIQGIKFRFIDTAGIRENPDNEIEKIGIERTHSKIKEANIIIYLCDGSKINSLDDENYIYREFQYSNSLKHDHNQVLFVINKIDRVNKEINSYGENSIQISAKNKIHIEELKQMVYNASGVHQINENQTIVSNIRHLEALKNSFESLNRVKDGLQAGISGDLVALDIRQCLYYLGLITGEISTDDLLSSIFSRFCIGK
jgi:tRNA modification GTPase